jgi:hypothetical protein
MPPTYPCIPPAAFGSAGGHFLGEELLRRLFGAVFSHPQQEPALKIIDHREIDLPLALLTSSMPITCTGDRLRCFKSYCTDHFTMVATLFQFSPYSRAVPCQLNSRASMATALDRAVDFLASLPTESAPQ